MNYTYKIIMYTPLGPRYGYMHLTMQKKKIDGYIDILGSRGICNGALHNDGKFQLTGNIQTLVRTINFTANGTLDNKEINLILQGQRHNYKIKGKIYSEDDSTVSQHKGSNV